MTRTLLVFAKLPQRGRAKTRLARGLGDAAALAFYRGALAATLHKALGGPWRTVLCVSPDWAAARPRLWPLRVALRKQGRGDLGARMARALAAQRGPAVLIGCDIPEMTKADFAAAFAALGGNDLVFGPALDGGYWLVGARGPRFVAGLFARVRWSSEHALADTRANAKGRRVAMLRTVADIDDTADYAAWKKRG